MLITQEILKGIREKHPCKRDGSDEVLVWQQQQPSKVQELPRNLVSKAHAVVEGAEL